jgi:RNA polymerase sigma-70 factor, ECF subfamily
LSQAKRLISLVTYSKPAEASFGLDSTENFSLLYSNQHLAIYRFIYGLLGASSAEAEDLTAETFERAWQARRRFRGNESAAVGWLFTIARRLVIDAHRRRQVRGPSEDIEMADLLDSNSTPEEQTSALQQKQILWKLLQSLPLKQREMVVLRYMLDWRVIDIARYLKMTENNVSVTLRRTLERLHRDWPRFEREEKNDVTL